MKITGLMSSDFTLSEFAEVNQRDMARFQAGSSQNEVVLRGGEGDKVVDLIFFELEGLNDVLNLKAEEVNQEHFVVESNDNFVEPNLDLLYL